MKRYFAIVCVLGCWLITGCGYPPAPLTPTPVTTPIVTKSPLLIWLEANAEPVSTPSVYFGADFPVIGAENIAQLREIARYGKGSRPVIAWSSDGKRFAIGTQATIYLYDAVTLDEIVAIDQPTEFLAFWPDETTLVSVRRNSILLWDVETGKKVDELDTGGNGWSNVVFSPDGHTIAMSWILGPVKIWDFKKKQELVTLYEEVGFSYSLSFSPNGKMLALGVDEKVELWDMQAFELVKSYPADSYFDLEFSRDGNTLALATIEDAVELWDMQTDKMKIRFDGFDAFALLQDDSIALAILEEGFIQFRNTSDGSFLRNFSVQGENALKLSLSPDEKRILMLSPDGTIKLRDLASGNELHAFPGFLGGYYKLTLTPDNRFLAAVFDDHKIRILDMNTGNWIYVLESPSDWDSPWELVFSPDGKRVAAMADGKLKVWDMATGQEIFISNLQLPYENQLAFSINGQLLALVKESHLEFRDVNTWEIMGNIDLASTGSWSSTFLPNGHLFVLSPDDRYENLLFWDALTPGTEYLIPLHPDYFASQAISSDGKLLAVGEKISLFPDICDVKFYSVISGTNLGNLTNCQGYISRMVFSPDNQILAVGMHRGEIKFFDFGSRTEVTARSHTADVAALIFSQDGRFFVSSSWDGTIRVWAVAP